MKKAVICLMMAVCLCAAAAGCSKKNEVTEKEDKKQSTETKTDDKEEKEEYKVIGTKTDTSYEVLMKNSTGKDVTGISIKTSDKTEYPANMMKSDQVLKNGETAQLYYTPEKTADANAAATDKAINVVYNVQLTMADDSKLELSSLGFDDILKDVEFCFEDDVVFAKYASKASGDEVSTKEQELGVKAQKEVQAQAAAEAEAKAAADAQAAAQAADVQSGAQENTDDYTDYSYAEETPQAPAEDPVPQETAPEQSADNCLDGVVINQ